MLNCRGIPCGYPIQINEINGQGQATAPTTQKLVGKSRIFVKMKYKYL